VIGIISIAGKPQQNAFIELHNGSRATSCSHHREIFDTLDDARRKLAPLAIRYTRQRQHPHSSLFPNSKPMHLLKRAVRLSNLRATGTVDGGSRPK